MSVPDLHLSLPAKAENVGVVRHALAGLAEAMGMDAGRIGDLKTIVTEACMNAVVHAYPERVGAIEVDAVREGAYLVITVRDEGSGIRPRVETERQSLRMGLPLIAALSNSFELRGGTDGGTVVRMSVSLSENGATPAPPPVREADPGAALTLPASGLVATVLSRVISIFAVRADFSVDRLSDAVLLGDAVASEAESAFPDGTARVTVDETDGVLSVRVGPLVTGAGERLIDRMRIPELDASLEHLADTVRVETHDDGSERLMIEIGSRAPAS